MSIRPTCFVPCDWCKNGVPLQYGFEAQYISAEDSTRRNCHQEGESMMEPNTHLVCADRYLGTNVVSCCMTPPRTITLNSSSDRASASIGKTRIGSSKRRVTLGNKETHSCGAAFAHWLCNHRPTNSGQSHEPLYRGRPAPRALGPGHDLCQY
ncbi:hypothetical protein BS47DRAFT_842238 [Hydnum rufescens UP504]|uniref:Uncharacterized protein n=1 Tax=Hydnum rufescens UP504 TaxID=1448309 RepID=A0A9P6AZP4_9AGAM|nr:hypothetical protein BS47DRAFT_842238 [Hydnum rufescens UP504]